MIRCGPSPAKLRAGVVRAPRAQQQPSVTAGKSFNLLVAPVLVPLVSAFLLKPQHETALLVHVVSALLALRRALKAPSVSGFKINHFFLFSWHVFSQM